MNEYDKAIKDFERALDLDKNNDGVLSEFALLLASCPVDKYRDGARAVALSRLACIMTDWKSARAARSLASSLAETGDFQSAVMWQKKALELLPAGKIAKRVSYERCLDAFKNGKPYRE